MLCWLPLSLLAEVLLQESLKSLSHTTVSLLWGGSSACKWRNLQLLEGKADRGGIGFMHKSEMAQDEHLWPSRDLRQIPMLACVKLSCTFSLLTSTRHKPASPGD